MHSIVLYVFYLVSFAELVWLTSAWSAFTLIPTRSTDGNIVGQLSLLAICTVSLQCWCLHACMRLQHADCGILVCWLIYAQSWLDYRISQPEMGEENGGVHTITINLVNKFLLNRCFINITLYHITLHFATGQHHNQNESYMQIQHHNMYFFRKTFETH